MKVCSAAILFSVVLVTACGSTGKVGDACTTAEDCEEGLECHVDEHDDHEDEEHEDEEHEDEEHEDEEHEDVGDGGICEEADAHDHD